ncbi:MAG TPA: hypothetical protein VLE19_01245 [Pyrinomonadaceae bacterium]|nr:hypothetical protein [Pyrinomonadaceae bacterium]
MNVAEGDTIKASGPKPLFDTGALTGTDFRNHYVRFPINSLNEERGNNPISVVVNWTVLEVMTRPELNPVVMRSALGSAKAEWARFNWQVTRDLNVTWP